MHTLVGRSQARERRASDQGSDSAQYSRMELERAVVLWLAYRRWKKRKRAERRRFRIHPILRDRMTHSMFITLYPNLRQHKEKFFNYFRMSIESFDELLNIAKDDLSPCENYVIRDTVTAEEKLVITLRLVMFFKIINLLIKVFLKLFFVTTTEN